MNTLHRATLMLALAASAMPAFAFYQVVEETARIEIAPGNVRTEHFDRIATPIGPVDQEHSHSFDQTLQTATNSQVAGTYLRQAIPHRRGDRQFLQASVYSSATGADVSNVAQQIRYEVIFDVFDASFLFLDSTAGLTFEKIASDNTRQVLDVSQNTDVGPGRYAATLDLSFHSPLLGQPIGDSYYGGASFQLLQSVVPEPASWALIGAGLFSVAGVRRLRRQPGV